MPEDPDGLWIHHMVAKAINARDASKMRPAFITALRNQRGVFRLTEGKDELELAETYRQKAEALETEGYSRFATAMRELADWYERDAKREASRDPYEA